jgi:hypothetical protein
MGATVIAGSKRETPQDGIGSIIRYTCMTPVGNGAWRLDVGGIRGEVASSGREASLRFLEICKLSATDFDALIQENIRKLDPEI